MANVIEKANFTSHIFYTWDPRTDKPVEQVATEPNSGI